VTGTVPSYLREKIGKTPPTGDRNAGDGEL